MTQINVCYLATKNFYEMCHKSAESLIKHKKPDSFLNLIILAPDVVDPSDVEYFSDLNSDTVQVTVKIVSADSYFKDMKSTDFNPEFGGLPNHNFKYGFYKIECMKLPYDRVLFLDCDTIIFDDLSELFEMPLDKPLAVVEERWDTENKVYRGCFNSGVILFNNKYIDDSKYNEFIEIAKSNSTNDQSIFNDIFNTPGNLHYLPPIYNCGPRVMFSIPEEIELYFKGEPFNNTIYHNLDFRLLKWCIKSKGVKIAHIFGAIKANYNEIKEYLEN